MMAGQPECQDLWPGKADHWSSMVPGTIFSLSKPLSIDSGGPYSPVPGNDAANCQQMKVARLEERLFGPGGALLRLRTLRFHHRCWPRESSPVSWRPGQKPGL